MVRGEVGRVGRRTKNARLLRDSDEMRGKQFSQEVNSRIDSFCGASDGIVVLLWEKSRSRLFACLGEQQSQGAAGRLGNGSSLNRRQQRVLVSDRLE